MSIDADEERRDREGQNGAAASTSGSSKRPHFPGWSVAWARWKATVEPLTRKLDPGELPPPPPPGLTDWFLATCWAAGVGMLFGVMNESRRIRTMEGPTSSTIASLMRSGGKSARDVALEVNRERFARIVRACNRGGYFFGTVAGAFGLYRVLEVMWGGFAPELFAVGGVLSASTAALLRGVPGRRLRSALALSALAGPAGLAAGHARVWLEEVERDLREQSEREKRGAHGGAGDGDMQRGAEEEAPQPLQLK